MTRHLVRAFAVAFVLTAPAQAATVELRTGPHSYSPTKLVYSAAPGERNALDVVVGPVVTTFRERDAPITAGNGCVPQDDGSVACFTGESEQVTLGDGDDAALLTAADGDDYTRVEVDGEAGADQLAVADDTRLEAKLRGGDGADRLTGGDGYDELIGGAGPDDLDGRGGADTLNGDGDGAAPAADRIDGGAGEDIVSYADRRTPVAVRLGAPGSGGGHGEHDLLRRVESATGGAGADRLVGDAGRNELVGGPGADVISGLDANDHLDGGDGDDRLDGGAGRDDVIGGGGDDRLTGGPGADGLSGGPSADVLIGGDGDDSLNGDAGSDRLAGGAGDDHLYASAGRSEHDVAACGAGSDELAQPQAALVVPRDCERLSLDDELVLRRRTGTQTLGFDARVRYGRNCGVRFSAGRVVFGLRRRVVGVRSSPRVPLSAQHPASIAVPLRGLGRYASVRVIGDARYRCTGSAEPHVLGTFTLALRGDE